MVRPLYYWIQAMCSSLWDYEFFKLRLWIVLIVRLLVLHCETMSSSSWGYVCFIMSSSWGYVCFSMRLKVLHRETMTVRDRDRDRIHRGTMSSSSRDYVFFIQSVKWIHGHTVTVTGYLFFQLNSTSNVISSIQQYKINIPWPWPWPWPCIWCHNFTHWRWRLHIKRWSKRHSESRFFFFESRYFLLSVTVLHCDKNIQLF